jgi:DNA-binding NtrC family response regulator
MTPALAAAKDDRTPVRDPRPSGEDEPGRRSRAGILTVLLVEDEVDVREPNAVALEQAGYRVIQAESWRGALSLSQEQHPRIDLIVTDLVMPDGAGVEVFARLRREQGPIPVIVFSAYPRVMRLLDGVLEGVVEWLQKPLDVAIVVEAVDRAFDRA